MDNIHSSERFSKLEKDKEILLNNISQLLECTHWGDSLLLEAEKKSNFDKSYSKLLFQNGIVEMAQAIEYLYDKKMIDLLDKVQKSKSIRGMITDALEARIISVMPKQVLIQQDSLFLLPTNLYSCWKSELQTCDLIWRYANDQSTDFNFYTKRGLLHTVYSLTKKYYIADTSKNYNDTKNFIKMSLNGVVNISKMVNNIFKIK